jgi:hypothetical protein
MIMKTTELIKKLGSKLLGKKETTATAVQLPPDEKAPLVPLLDKLGVIELHPYSRN